MVNPCISMITEKAGVTASPASFPAHEGSIRVFRDSGDRLPEPCERHCPILGACRGRCQSASLTAARMPSPSAEVPRERVAVVSGPNLAGEIVRGQPAATVVACADERAMERLQAACYLPPWFRPYTNPDVIGVELGGAVKNVIALAVGISAGMGLGDNVGAMLMTRGLAEITRLGTVLGADPHTFAGLAGMGDLVATCVSPLSRNRTFGENLGRGMTLAEVIAATKQTAEGVKSCESVLELARKHDVEMPITEVVVAVVHDAMPPSEAGVLLMSRTPKPERYGL
ncbi:NAD(P)H-dependent glycerol-3-phosphate dehydrogenase [Streptosporangium sp. NPDC048865]|uniref:NAD(P)H-dependent glycerol-3-phosphate dehydrogenase n=1 Tax=Streptosporangium sp. NPDC048865 TaxID=3155766 RepID=UPI0034136C1D